MRFSVYLAFGASLTVFNPNLALAADRSCGATTSKQSGFSRFFKDALGDLLGKEMAEAGLSGNTQRSLRSFLGDAIVCALTAEEQKKLAVTSKDALDSGKVGDDSERTWTSDDRPGVGGRTRVVSRSTVGGNDCAITSVFVVDENGQEGKVEKEVCQGEQGWA